MPGPAPKPAEERRSQGYRLRLLPAELVELHRWAQAQGRELSVLARETLLRVARRRARSR